MTPIAPHITAFLRERLPLQRGASEHTCESYSYTFQLLFQFSSKRFNVTPSELFIEQIDAQLIMNFLDYIVTERENCSRTRNVRLAAIKSFMRFIEHRVPSILDQSRRILAIPFKKFDSKLVDFLSMDEIKAILNTPDISKRSGIRDRAMIHLCFAAGLRVSELISLQLTSLNLQSYQNIRIMGKGRKERCLPLWKETVKDLRAWLSVRENVLIPELFLNARNEPISRYGFNYILRKYVQSATKKCPSIGDKRVTPHVLRHSCAMMVLQATGDLRKVSLWLGHTNMQTTEIYTRADPEENLETINKMTPPFLKKGKFRPSDKLIALLKKS